MNSRHTPFLLLASVAIFAFTGCTTIPKETLDWHPRDYVLVFTEKTGWKGVRGDDTMRRIYAPSSATVDNWTETAQIIDFPIAITLDGKVSWNAESVMNAEKGRWEANKCSTKDWTVLQKDDASILYEWRNIDCPGRLHQHEIGRIVMGKWYLWMISYGIRNKLLSPGEREELVKSLMNAKVVGNEATAPR